MCGIVGLYNLPAPEPGFGVLLDRIAHRGPDAADHAAYAGANWEALFGHRRLSIIDLSEAANQPFVKGGHALVFNGEIYNYRELRDELAAHGHTFRTASDTEVLLTAWLHWGADGLRRLRGMFAFALLNLDSGALVLARDRFGIKPLHYAEVGNGLAFCSELKGLLGVLPDRRLDPMGLVASLAYGWLPDAQSWRSPRKRRH